MSERVQSWPDADDSPKARGAVLSERLQGDIDRQLQAGELVVGWTQAGAIAILALYAFSPKSISPVSPFLPILETLGFYGLFTAARLVLAYRGRLRRNLAAVFAVIDIAVLLTMIWGMRPTPYLATTILMYVFILIALRTLSFEPFYVLLAGCCAALGWFALEFYAAPGWGGTAAAS